MSLTLLFIITGFYFVFIKTQGAAQLEVMLGEGKSVKIKLNETNKTSIDSILETLFAEEKSRRLTTTILKEYYAFHKLDSELINSIRQEHPMSDFSIELRSLLKNMEGPMSRKYHSFYNTASLNVIDGLKKNGKDHKVSSELRKLAHMNDPYIFPNDSLPVRVSFPESTRIQSGFAAACNGSEYIGRNVVLRNPGNGAMIQVYVRNTFPCSPEEGHRIQLTSENADNLFPDRVRQSYELANMTVAEPGMKFDIIPISI
ncbi:MAG: hypothetical protein ACR2PX_04010 [Endozoicomonas sp.]|uniref:hypothetical protein n=1 Tax=Endozoicomonas sp. TaxID=1892382 RepID=UPI003D9B4BF7